MDKERFLEYLRKNPKIKGHEIRQSSNPYSKVFYKIYYGKGGLTQAKTDAGIGSAVVREQILHYLDKNPARRGEIMKAVEGAAHKHIFYLKAGGHIFSTGPRWWKYYYLKNDEEFAKNKLETGNPEKIILDAVDDIISHNKLMDILRKLDIKDPHNKVSGIVREGKLKKITLSQSKTTSGRIYKTDELFGGMSNLTYYYKPGWEDKVADMIIKALPPKKKMTRSLKRALTHHLKKLPAKIFEKIHEHYAVQHYTPKCRINKLALVLSNKTAGLLEVEEEEVGSITDFLTRYGLLEDGAYEIRKVRYTDPDTADSTEEDAIVWKHDALGKRGDSDIDMISSVAGKDETHEKILDMNEWENRKELRPGTVKTEILKYLHLNPNASTKEIAENTEMNRRTIYIALGALEKTGCIKKEGGRRNYRYELAEMMS